MVSESEENINESHEASHEAQSIGEQTINRLSVSKNDLDDVEVVDESTINDGNIDDSVLITRERRAPSVILQVTKIKRNETLSTLGTQQFNFK